MPRIEHWVSQRVFSCYFQSIVHFLHGADAGDASGLAHEGRVFGSSQRKQNLSRLNEPDFRLVGADLEDGTFHFEKAWSAHAAASIAFMRASSGP
jgi:hypothetical protein